MLKHLMTSSAWRWVVGAIYFALAIWLVVYEHNAQSLLSEAQVQAEHGEVVQAVQTLEQLVLSYPIAMSVPSARDALQRLQSSEQEQFEVNLDIHGPTLLQDLHPLAVDWLPLWGWPACAFAMLLVCLTRLGRRNRWAVAALGLSVMMTLGTLSIWAWYGFEIGHWFLPVLDLLSPLLVDPSMLYLATWLLIVITAAMLLCPITKPIDEQASLKAKTRPDSPNDPRLALEYLDAQRKEKRFTNIEYARRREAILSQI